MSKVFPELPKGLRVRIILVHGTWPNGPIATMQQGRWWSKSIASILIIGTAPLRQIKALCTRLSKMLKEDNRVPEKHPLWFEDNSSFNVELRRELEASGVQVVGLDRHLWSGMNSINERERAAIELAKVIEKDCLEKDIPHYLLIAHSHGGNVALRSLAHLEEPAKNRMLIVTLATPFLEMFQPTKGGIFISAFC